MWIFGVILILISVALLFASQKQARRHQTLAGTVASRISDLRDLAASVAAELGPGYFNEVTEVSGNATAKQPLVAPLSQQKCVHYNVRVVHEFREKDTSRNSSNTQPRMTSRTETVAGDRRGEECQLDDGSAQVDVLLREAALTLVKSHNSFIPGFSNRRHASCGVV